MTKALEQDIKRLEEKTRYRIDSIALAEARAREEAYKPRSAWDKGVHDYIAELLDNLGEYIAWNKIEAPEYVSRDELESILLNGAENWKHYSWSGCSLIYNCDIADRLCTSSELLKTRYGERRPNEREEWLDVQARALNNAFFHIRMHLVVKEG